MTIEPVVAGQPSADSQVDPGNSTIARQEALHPLWAPLQMSAGETVFYNPYQGAPLPAL